MKNYTKIHLHTHYSNPTTNIDSITKHEEYIKKAKECGMKAIAFTEHGNIFNWYKKKAECEKNDIKYIHAVEAYITESLDMKTRDNYHCCLYAKNINGFKELNRLMSNANHKEDGHFYYAPRITLDELINTSENIIISTACLGGILSKGIKNVNLINKFEKFLKDNKERCFMEIQHHNVKDQIEYNKYLFNKSIELGVRLIAGTDTHALNEDQMKARKVLQIAKNVKFKDEETWDLTFKTYEELILCYKKQNCLDMNVVIDAIENTNVLADMIEEFELDKSPKYPELYENPIDTFKRKINEGVIRRGLNKLSNYRTEYIPRILEEFEVYKKVNSINYMLLQEKITSDAIKYGGVQFGYGRGSVNGSIIAYILGITEMDSVKYKLNFYRFMNPSRVSMPDIDGDHGDKDREWVIDYIFKMENVYTSSIITFNTIVLKGGIREVGSALNIPKQEIDEISKNIDTKEQKYRSKYKELFKYVDLLSGTIVSVGSHPAGVIVSPIKLDDSVGLCRIKDNDNVVSILDMKGIDALSFVKLDILGLDTIGIINDTCKLANIKRITPDNVDLKDKNVWESIKESTVGVFQMESDMAHKYLNDILSEESFCKIRKKYPNITEFDLFMFVNAAIRPAAANFRDNATQGICNSTGIQELDDALSDTLCYILLQEQIMKFLVDFCGYSDAESDSIRRAIGKKQDTSKFTDEIKDRFLKFTPNKYNISFEKAINIIDPFIETVKDASDYGFSKNHNVPYAITGYVAAYLRYYYPLEFICSSLNVWTRKKHKEDIIRTTEYANSKGIHIKDAKFRYSKSDYFIHKESNSITKGIQSIKFLNKNVGEDLYNLKDNEYKTFTDALIDICNYTDSRQLEILIKLDFFDEFGKSAKLLKVKDNFDNLYSKKQFKKDMLYSDVVNEILKLEYKETDKLYKELDTRLLCNALESNLEDEDLHISEKVRYSIEYTGSCKLKSDDVPGNMCIVTDLDTRYSARITLYCLKSGNTKTFKCESKIFKYNTLELFSTIQILETEEKNRKKRVENGINEKTGKMKYKYIDIENEYESWISNYKIVNI